MMRDEQPTVMIVDDDPDLLLSMSATLRSNGFRVDARSQPPNWIDLKEAHPALIFLDVDLGLADGSRICKSIKENLSRELPIVLISGHPEDQLNTEMKYAHADGALGKPFDRDTLLRVAEHYTRKAAGGGRSSGAPWPCA